ncbi:MAG: site-2 protease family protein [Victivallales bacterium]|nr:site-2 protease family protein [Victivallales bacterium]
MFFLQELFQGDPIPGLIQIGVVIFSICCHEFAHAWTALQQGDATAADAGHLTLNPLKQMGVFSLIALLFLGIAWGAVPVNPSRMKHKYSHMLVALAGPAMNLLLFALFTIAYVVNADFIHNPGLKLLTWLGGMLNVVLFIFNLLPIPPLDGWTVFGQRLCRHLNFNSEFIKGAAVFLVLLLLFSGQYFFYVGQKVFVFGVENIQFVLVHWFHLVPGV